MKSSQKINLPRRDFIKKIGLIPIVNIIAIKTTFSKGMENKWRNGTIQKLAGSGTPGFSGDNGLAKFAKLNGPAGLAIDLDDNLYIAEIGNSIIRKIDAKTKIITTIAGNGHAGYSGDGKLATIAELNRPEGVFIDKEENLYIADSGNQRIRKVTKKTGIISTIAETGVNRLRMYNINENSYYTIAGTGNSGIAEDFGKAIESNIDIHGVRVDSSGRVYFLDYIHHLIYSLSFESD